MIRNAIAVMLAVLLGACGNGAAPGANAADSGVAVPVVNGGFEEPADGISIPGWVVAQLAGRRAYEMGVVKDAAAQGQASFRMHRLSPQIYGAITQSVAVAAFAGKTVELSARVKQDGVGPEGWMLVLDSAAGRASAVATGTADWHELRVRATLPADAKTISIGAILLDAGTGWLDDVQLHVVAP
jgi:hypothetical protein